MKFNLRFHLVIGCLFLSTPSVLAMSCEEPAMLDPKLSQQDLDQIFVENLFDHLRSDDANRFIVYGQFERTDDKPLIHVIDHKERMRRWEANGWRDTETSAGIEYTYRNALSFSGFRLTGGEEQPFVADKTIISIRIDGEFILGQMPPLDRSVIGAMWEPEPVYYEIDSSPCRGYQEISEIRYRMLLGCIESNGCRW